MIQFIIYNIIVIFEILLPSILNQSKNTFKFYYNNKKIFDLIILISFYCLTLYKYIILDLETEEINLLLKLLTGGLNISYFIYKMIK